MRKNKKKSDVFTSLIGFLCILGLPFLSVYQDWFGFWIWTVIFWFVFTMGLFYMGVFIHLVIHKGKEADENEILSTS